MDLAPLARHPQVEDLGDRLIVNFRASRSWGTLVGLTVWLLVWTLGGLAAAIQVPKSSPGVAAFLLFWLCGWVVGECVAVGIMSWQLFGRESLAVTHEELAVRRQIGRFATVKRYDVTRVRDIKATHVPHDEDETPRKDFCLEVWYDDKSVFIGEGMREHEADYIASVVLSRLRRRSWWNEEETVRPSTEEEPVPRIDELNRKRAFFFAGAVIAGVVIGGASLVAVFGHHRSRPARKPAVSRPDPLLPSSKDFSNAREYAAAMTSWALNSGRSELVGRPRCDRRSTWAHWSCHALARGDWIPKTAGLAIPYRCESVSTGGVTCGLATPMPPSARGPQSP